MRSMLPRWVAAAATVGLTLCLAGPAAAAGNVERGKLIGYTCLGCHGIEEYKNVYPTYSVPKLVGQHPAYLVAALKAYRSKERSHATMYVQASSLSDQDIEDVAAYLAGTALPAGGTPVGATPAKVTEVCVACHGQDGVGITGDFPTLAGQHADYLQRALNEYRKGDRKNAIMPALVAGLTDADVRAVAQYYGAQRPALQTVSRPPFWFSVAQAAPASNQAAPASNQAAPASK